VKKLSMVVGLILLLFTPSAKAVDLNWLVNGDFKDRSGWDGNLQTQPGHDGKPSAYLHNDSFTWTANEQEVKLPQPPPPAIEISGWMKCQDVVKGTRDWEMARITVVFFDANKQQVGGWPAEIASAIGSQDWKLYSNQYKVPAFAATAKVSLQMCNCKGSAWYSDLRMLVYDYDLKPLAAGAASTHPSLKPASSIKTDNWLLDPDFETPGSDAWNMAKVDAQGHNSSHSLVVENTAPAWTLPAQDVSFRGKTPARIVYGGWVRTDQVVRGKEDYMAARLGVDFRDADNKQVGGWQAEACAVSGTTDWTYYEKSYPVPAGSAAVHVDAGLGNCAGKAWFDDLTLTLLDDKGNKIPVVLQTEQASDTSDWYTYQPPLKADQAPLDLSFLNEAPAGGHGFVTNQGGHFTFADGTRIKFWGTDGVGPRLFIPHEEADLVAVRMRKLGINLVRLHFLDNDWGEVSLFDPKADNTQTFNPAALDQMDYLIAALKKNGIYVYPDWSVGRKYREGDKVPGYKDLEEGAKTVIHFSRRIIELNKKYAEALLTHMNPYTGLALKDDPVYVGNEIVNESSIFCNFGEQKFPQPFWDELQKMFEAWGGKGPITHFKFDWDSQSLKAVENPENADASLKFLLHTVLKSNLEMKAFLAKLSPHALLTGSNIGLPVLGNIKSDSVMDFMDTHSYWDHPQIWNIAGGWSNVDRAPMNNTSQLKNPFQGSLLFGLCSDAVLGKPLIVTEWNDCFPNEYRLEGPILMAAYGCLQDWDGFLQFDFGPSLIGSEKMTNFSINSRPDNEPLYQAGALIFEEGLLKPSDVTIEEPIADQDILANGSKSSWLFDHPWLPYVAKVAKRFVGSKPAAPADLSRIEKLYNAEEKEIDSSTGEETLYYGKGILKIDSPMVQGLVGALSADSPDQVWGTTGMWAHVAPRNPWTAILAVALDHQPLSQSKKFVVFAVGRAENSGQVFNPTRTALKDSGHPPILMQGVMAKISIVDHAADHYLVTPIDESGQKLSSLSTTMNKGALEFNISPKDRSSYYLVELKE